MSEGAWHPDPTGRFVQRYYDGTNWTAHVADAAGNQSQDPMPVNVPATAEGPVTTQPATTAPTGTPASTAAPSTTRAVAIRIGPALVLAAIGAVATLVSMVALDWFELFPGSTLDRSDLGDVVSFASQIGGTDMPITAPTEWFFSFGWILVILATGLAFVASLVPAAKTVAAAACGIGAAWVVYALVDISEGLEGVMVGAWIGVAGLICAAVGALLARPPA
jgi:hypothetical protein